VEEIQVNVLGSPAVARRAGWPPGESPRLVLIHGAGTNHRFWDPLLPYLEGFPVVAPSMPGRCGSAGAALETVGALAGWLAAAIEALGAAPAILIGHSLGGAVAIELAHAPGAAGLVAGLVLLATGARLRVGPEIRAAAEAAAASGVKAALTGAAYGQDVAEELMSRVEEARAATPPASELADWRAAHEFDRMGELSAIAVPTLVLVGERDGLTPPKYARYLADHVPGASLEILPGAGHMLPVERPEEVARAVRRFGGSIPYVGYSELQAREAP
jgi:pimeloyl-ACP methyl ester carboxylesterase